jgi:hypothetical protein
LGLLVSIGRWMEFRRRPWWAAVFLLRLGALGGLDCNFLFFQGPICNVGCNVLDINPLRSQKKKKIAKDEL